MLFKLSISFYVFAKVNLMQLKGYYLPIIFLSVSNNKPYTENVCTVFTMLDVCIIALFKYPPKVQVMVLEKF